MNRTMIQDMKIGLMTKYLIKKILKRYQDEFILDAKSFDIKFNKMVDIESILMANRKDSSQYSIYIQQLESLAKIYQVYEKQNQIEEKEKIERKIISLLGLQLQRDL